jgi:hypothetical protein
MARAEHEFPADDMLEIPSEYVVKDAVPGKTYVSVRIVAERLSNYLVEKQRHDR